MSARAPRTWGHGLSRFAVLSSSGASVLARAASQLCQLATIIAAAHVLSPAEFGLFALVSACAIIAAQIADAGVSDFIISWRGADERGISGTLFASVVAATTVMSFGLAVAAGIVAFAPDQTETASLLALFSVWVLLTAYAGGQLGVLVRQERLVTSAALQVTSEASGLLVTLLALRNGHGVFALVYGRLVTQGLFCLSASTVTRVLPTTLPSRQTLLGLWRFYKSICVTRVLSTGRSYAATFLVGAFLGLTSVGIYRAAERLIGAFAELVAEPVRLLGWVVFARARDGAEAKGLPVEEALNEAAAVFIPIVLAISIPAFALVSFFSEELVDLVLGKEWRDAALVASILIAARLLLLPSAVTTTLLSFTHEIRRLPPISLLNVIVAICFVLVSAQFGAVGVAVGEVCAAAVALGTTVYLQSRYAGIDWGEVALRSAFIIPIFAIAFAGLVLCAPLIASFGWPDIVTAAAASFLTLALYAAGVALVRPAAVMHSLSPIAKVRP